MNVYFSQVKIITSLCLSNPNSYTSVLYNSTQVNREVKKKSWDLMEYSKYGLCWLGTECKMGVRLNRPALRESVFPVCVFWECSGSCGYYMVLHAMSVTLSFSQNLSLNLLRTRSNLQQHDSCNHEEHVFLQQPKLDSTADAETSTKPKDSKGSSTAMLGECWKCKAAQPFEFENQGLLTWSYFWTVMAKLSGCVAVYCSSLHQVEVTSGGPSRNLHSVESMAK